MMKNSAEILRLKTDNNSLGISQESWLTALKEAKPDPIVQIRHGSLNGSADYRLHVAAIPKRVGCHFHKHGNEDYAVVQGNGRLYWGKVTKESNVEWEKPVDVRTGDSFIIPEGYAHQLASTNKGTELVIIFGCPDSHLDDDADRTILADAPELKV